MSEQTNAVTFNQEPGQVPGNVEETQQNAAQQQFLTLDEAQKLMQQAEERAFRRAQGLFDKGNQKYRDGLKALETQLQSLQSVGVQVTPEQKAVLQASVYEQAFTPEQAVSPDGQPKAAVEPTPEAPDPVTAEAWRLMQEAGTVIEDGDPEIDVLDQTNPYAFLKSIESAIASKQARLGKTPANAGTPVATHRTPTNLGAGGQTTNPISNTKDPDSLIRQGLGLG